MQHQAVFTTVAGPVYSWFCWFNLRACGLTLTESNAHFGYRTTLTGLYTQPSLLSSTTTSRLPIWSAQSSRIPTLCRKSVTNFQSSRKKQWICPICQKKESVSLQNYKQGQSEMLNHLNRNTSYSFLILALDRGQRSVPCLTHNLPLGRRTPGTQCIGSRVGPRAGLYAKANRKILCSCQGLSPCSSSLQSDIIMTTLPWLITTPLS